MFLYDQFVSANDGSGTSSSRKDGREKGQSSGTRAGVTSNVASGTGNIAGGGSFLGRAGDDGNGSDDERTRDVRREPSDVLVVPIEDDGSDELIREAQVVVIDSNGDWNVVGNEGVFEEISG